MLHLLSLCSGSLDSAPSARGINFLQDPANVLGHPDDLEGPEAEGEASTLRGDDAVQGLPPVDLAGHGTSEVSCARVDMAERE